MSITFEVFSIIQNKVGIYDFDGKTSVHLIDSSDYVLFTRMDEAQTDLKIPFFKLFEFS